MNNKGADQTARMRKLVCALAVHNHWSDFLASRPNYVVIGNAKGATKDLDCNFHLETNLQVCAHAHAHLH